MDFRVVPKFRAPSKFRVVSEIWTAPPGLLLGLLSLALKAFCLFLPRDFCGHAPALLLQGSFEKAYQSLGSDGFVLMLAPAAVARQH